MCMRERKRVSDIYNIEIEIEQVRVLRAGKSLTGLARAIGVKIELVREKEIYRRRRNVCV